MQRGTMSVGVLGVVLAVTLGCAGTRSMDEVSIEEESDRMARYVSEGDGVSGGAPPAAARPVETKGRSARSKDARNQNMEIGDAAAEPAPEREEEGEKGFDKIGDDGEAAAEEARTRSWFPESLLWRPLVETDDDGVATVPVRVPDQLTTWRVLALAHDRRGQQAGAEHRFVGTLPVYVEPVVPGWLYAGDRVALPVQAMNTTGDRIDAQLSVQASGAASGAAGGSLSLAAGGSAVRDLPMIVQGAGQATIAARLSTSDGGDAAERTVVVHPEGKPVQTTRGGALAGERSVQLPAPRGADPRTERVEVVVFPGPLAVVQAELDRLSGGPSDGAYAFAVAGQAKTLADAVGVELDDAVLRRLRILAWQRVVRATRSPSAADAADLLLGMREVEGHELAEQRVRILHRTLQDGQRADGSWSRVDRAPLQRVIVETALAARVLSDDATGPRLRAQGALERMLPDVDDPYTAAVVLASGLVDGDDAEVLRTLVRDAVVERDGQLTLPVPARVVNAWGVRPSPAEMLAVGALSLDGEARGDLVAALMQRWSAVYGFGAGRADPLALEAIVEALPTHDGEVTVALALDGRTVAQSTLDPSQPGIPAALTAAAGGAEQVTLTATPEVPGLTFVATRRSWVPWGGLGGLAGVDVVVDLGVPRVGEEATLTLQVAGPKGVMVTVEQGLPAGASVDVVALEQLGSLRGLEVRQDRVRLTTRPLGAGEILEIPVRVTPAFAGSFATVPLKVEAEGKEAQVEPVRWTVGSASRG